MDVIIDTYRAGTAPNVSICNLNGDLGRYTKHLKPLIPTIPITKLPPSLFDHSITQWLPIKFGRWLYHDHITLGEGRATLHLLQALVLLSKAHRHKVISMEDNQSWGCSAAKGRSPSIALNFLLRRKCALCVASQIHCILPWVQTSLMPADELSRVH